MDQEKEEMVVGGESAVSGGQARKEASCWRIGQCW